MIKFSRKLKNIFRENTALLILNVARIKGLLIYK